jgi:hypothetical protein
MSGNVRPRAGAALKTRLKATTLAAALVLLGTAAPLSVMAANLAPTVGITAPANGTSVAAPGNITLSVNAVDTDGTVSKVEYYNGTTLLGTSTAAPFSFNWVNAPAGNYVVTAKAYDNAGAASVSTPVNLHIGGTAIVGGTLSGYYQRAPGNATISASAVTSFGTIYKTEYYNGSSLLGTTTAAPHTYNWTNIPAGNYTISVKVFNALGGTATSWSPWNVTVGPANVPPAVSISSPATGANFATAPATVPLTVNASDSDGRVTKVEYYSGPNLLGSSTAAPFSYSWTNAPAGQYGVTAKAYDDAGGSTSSSPVTLNIGGSTLVGGTFQLTSSRAPGVLTITPNTVSSFGTIAKAEYFNGTTLLGTTTSAPHSFTWTNIPAGTYSLTTRLTNTLGGTASSWSPTTITVAAANKAPTVAISGPASGATFGTAPATVPLTVNAADSDGRVTKVEYYSGTVLLGASTVAPFRYNWTNAPAGNYSITAKAYDDLGASTVSAPVAVNVGGLYILGGSYNSTIQRAPGSVTATASTVSSFGTIVKTEFYNGSTLLGSTTVAPHTFTWSNIAQGSYTMSMKVYNAQGGSASSWSPYNFTVGPANVLPTVAITSPASGTSIGTAPAVLTIGVNAADSDGKITKVEYYSGSKMIGASTTAPFSLNWTSAPAGNYMITAKAYDDAGGTAVSSPIALNVGGPYIVGGTYNTTSSKAPGTVNLTPNTVSSFGAIVKTEYYSGSTLLGTTSAAPHTFSWTNVPAGTYGLTMKVTNDQGGTASSWGVTNVTINP